jgi:cell division protein FtsW
MTHQAKAILLIMYTLISIGVVMIYSTSAVYAEQTYGNSIHFLSHQLIAIAIGTIAFGICFSLNPDDLRRHAKLLICFAIILLIFVYLPMFGRSAGGARRWIQLPFFRFQPVEYAKLAVCIYFCDYLVRKRKWIREGSVTAFGPPLLILSVIGLLVLTQPDLGSCAFLLVMVGVLFFLSGIYMRYVMLVMGGAVGMLIFLVMSTPYRMNRILAFLDPWKDPQGSGFQIIQSYLAFGLGGVQGTGLGQSTQKLFYLPQGHTDFIFSIIGEELGLLGTLSVVILYAIFFVLGAQIAYKLKDPFRQLLAYSLVLLVSLQALLNLLVTVGLIPTKGLPLPFVSYGGSAIVFHMASVGILIAIDRASNKTFR